MLFKIVVLKNFAIFTGKAFRPATLLKRVSNTEYYEIFKNSFVVEHLRTAASDP